MHTARSWIILQHVAWEGPGLIGAIVGMGGPMGVRDTPSLPFLAAGQSLLRAAVERDLPVLGVCLGAQLFAAAFGARVDRGLAPEIGLGEVRLTTVPSPQHGRHACQRALTLTSNVVRMLSESGEGSSVASSRWRSRGSL